MECKLKDFEASLQQLKDCTYTEAAQRQEYELTLRQVQAELRGASLREQVIALCTDADHVVTQAVACHK